MFHSSKGIPFLIETSKTQDSWGWEELSLSYKLLRNCSWQHWLKYRLVNTWPFVQHGNIRLSKWKREKVDTERGCVPSRNKAHSEVVWAFINICMESVKMSMYPIFNLKHRNKTKSNLPLPTFHAKSLTIILFRFFKSQILWPDFSLSASVHYSLPWCRGLVCLITVTSQPLAGSLEPCEHASLGNEPGKGRGLKALRPHHTWLWEFVYA